jgi:hypothetical protein
MEICREQEPAFDPVEEDHLASCWLYQEATSKEKSHG